jgi:hypothetical protein
VDEPRKGVVCPEVGRVKEMNEKVRQKCRGRSNGMQDGAAESVKSLRDAKLILKNTQNSTAC